ncbi:PEP/pyruvate-binding domain-containing protein [Bdellovibrionota bacterium FG-2]
MSKLVAAQMPQSTAEPQFDLVPGITGERLSLEAFANLSGRLAGYPFIKLVVDRQNDRQNPMAPRIHFVNHSRYPFHSDYIGEQILKLPVGELDNDIDRFNQSVYLDPKRRFYLGILSLHDRGEKFFVLETVEIDNMDSAMVKFFYEFVKTSINPAFPLLFKPANHIQEAIAAEIPPATLPRVFSHELFSRANFLALNLGTSRGRVRAFRNEKEYAQARSSLEWYDIIVMHRVPDDIPRLSGIINAHHTTPLSHTNVLASGWQVPNCVQIGIFDQIDREGLDGQWVDYIVDANSTGLLLKRIDRPIEVNTRPAWSVQRIKLEEPEVLNTPIVELDALRMSDRYRYGTKAANLGELRHVLDHGSERMLGFYRVRRPPRANLLGHLAKFLDLSEGASSELLARKSWEFLKDFVQIPRGIALPFAIQQEFLETSPRIQQAIGKLKMALELGARETDSICLHLQSLIRGTRFPERLRSHIDAQIANHLSGVSCFVVRSSSNAEDLEGFSAAGIYESINHVTTAENVFQSIKEVWASLVSPRSVRLRHEVGISLDDCYMGVIVQEEIPAEMGGVLVTTNPMNRTGDFRNVYINVSPKSVANIVRGIEQPLQYLYNTVEGGGRTLSIGDVGQDLDDSRKQVLAKLAYAGRLLQSHFSPDYTFSVPVDVEWVANSEGLFILQLRPYAK